jgi:hypothetical protein
MKKQKVNRQLMLYLREQNPDMVRPRALPWWCALLGWAVVIALLAGAMRGFIHGS